MSTMPTIPMIAPDGTIGDIPLHKTNEASNNGFKVGKEVEINGQKGVIPFERYGDFMREHGPITGRDAAPQQIPEKSLGQKYLEGTGLPALYDLATNPSSVWDGLQNWRRQYIDANQAKDRGKELSLMADLTPAGAVHDDVKAGNYGGAAATSAGFLTSLLAPKVLPKVAGRIGEGIADTQRLSHATDPVSAAEVGARNITEAVNPVKQGFQNFIDAVQAHGGDIREYAHAKDLRVDGVLDYSKAAKGLADETYQRYRSYLDPLKDTRYTVPESYQGAGASDIRTGTGYGEMRSVGRRAPLGEIDKRIGQINDLTHKADSGKATIDSNARFALEAEHGALTDILHKAIADSLGPEIQPEDVAALRQKFGKLNAISQLAEDSVNDRSGATARSEQGTKFNSHHTATGLAVDVANRIFRGGPNGIADRALVKAATSAKLSPSNLKLANALMQSKQELRP